MWSRCRRRLCILQTQLVHVVDGGEQSAIQHACVMRALDAARIGDDLLNTMLTVVNKADLMTPHQRESVV